MSRDRFISDNLYSMRERFKRNHEETNSGSVLPENTPYSSEIKPVVQEEQAPRTSPVQTRLSAISSDSSANEKKRDIRELEGRLMRDLSFLEAENESLRQRNKILEDFHGTATEVLKKLHEEELSSGQLDQLRNRYFQAYGRFESTFELRNAKSTTDMVNFAAPAAIPSSWPIVAAILISGGFVALTLLFLFGR